MNLPLDPVALKVWRRLACAAGNTASITIKALRHMCLAALIDALGRIEDTGMVGTGGALRDLNFWFDANMADPPSLDDMAARSGMGCRLFIRWFRSEIGSTPVSFFRQRRIREACRLLRSSESSIEQFAERTGFANRHHFTRVFSSETGRGPAAFRRGF